VFCNIVLIELHVTKSATANPDLIRSSTHTKRIIIKRNWFPSREMEYIRDDG